jgi:CRP/FNR family cyclic AMP-dependent transcriptional regulator
MSKTKIKLTAQDVPPEAQCPLYQVGEGFALNVPEVTPNSGKACIYVIKELISPLMEVTCKGFQRTLPLPTIFCPKGVRFAATLKQLENPEGSDYLACLRKVPLFVHLSPEDLNEIGERLEVRDYHIGDVIIRKGELGENFYIIHKGMVQVLQERRDGGTQILTTLGENECFGEMSLLTNEVCSATIRAATPLILLVILKEKFNELLKIVIELNQHFTKILATRLRKSNTLLEETLDKGVLGKLSMISLPELIQAIEVSGRSGVLTITYGPEMGKIYCTSGQVIDSELPHHLDWSPEECFYHLLTWSDGEFHFEQSTPHQRETKIRLDPINLLMEGLRRLDELGHSSQKS